MVNDFTQLHKLRNPVTLERVVKAVERWNTSLDNPGFCLACGEEDEACDPDTRNKQCSHCGRRQVFGASEILMNMTF